MYLKPVKVEKFALLPALEYNTKYQFTSGGVPVSTGVDVV